MYRQIKPHATLAGYIDAYWTVSGSEKDIQSNKILPDGCVDIIMNLGEDFVVDNDLTMKHGNAYLTGTMTRFKETHIKPGTNILGIRFKPAAFSSFYRYGSLHELTDNTIEFENKIAPDIQKTIQHPQKYLNDFFQRRLTHPKQTLLPVISDIQRNQGQLSVTSLAQRHCTTSRQLERSFKAEVGITPKEFIRLVRFQHALPLIRNKAGRSLLDIAFSCGYYDHAHLTNEIKHYTGEAPSRV